MKHKRISTIDKGWTTRTALEIIYSFFYLQGTDSYLALLPKTLAIPLLSEEGIGLAIAEIKFEILSFSLSSHPKDPGADIFGVKKVLFLPHSH